MNKCLVSLQVILLSVGNLFSADTSPSLTYINVAPLEAQKIAEEAFIYGYSLITTDITRVQMSNVPKEEGLHAPLGKFINVKQYPPADYRGVSAANADTLYSIAWVDLSEPVVFSHPDMGDRYFLFEMTDLWMKDFNSPGIRTAGGSAQNYLLTGPRWKGEVPSGLKHIPVETEYMVILGRTYADGTDEDYLAVNKLQDQLKLTPLSSWGKDYIYVAPPVNTEWTYNMTDKPQTVINMMDAASYFNRMASLMAHAAPPAKEDSEILQRMSKIGLIPGQKFDLSKLDPQVQVVVKDALKTGMEKIEKNEAGMGRMVNGWTITKGLGVYGTDYLKRATVAAFGWPANLEKDAVYPYTFVDERGAKLNGAKKYTLTFAKGQTPPVNGFWSITMYEIDKGWWFVPNELNKFTVSPRNNLKYNEDGSLTLYFQNESPGKEKESNWLPAPKGEFLLMLRMYWPKDTNPSILNDTWTPPAIAVI